MCQEYSRLKYDTGFFFVLFCLMSIRSVYYLHRTVGSTATLCLMSGCLTAVKDTEDLGQCLYTKHLLIYSDPLTKPFIMAISCMSLNSQRRKGPTQVWGRERNEGWIFFLTWFIYIVSTWQPEWATHRVSAFTVCIYLSYTGYSVDTWIWKDTSSLLSSLLCFFPLNMSQIQLTSVELEYTNYANIIYILSYIYITFFLVLNWIMNDLCNNTFTYLRCSFQLIKSLHMVVFLTIMWLYQHLRPQ